MLGVLMIWWLGDEPLRDAPVPQGKAGSIEARALGDRAKPSFEGRGSTLLSQHRALHQIDTLPSGLHSHGRGTDVDHCGR